MYDVVACLKIRRSTGRVDPIHGWEGGKRGRQGIQKNSEQKSKYFHLIGIQVS